MWLIGVDFGVPMLVGQGIISQSVPYFLQLGLSQAQAVAIMPKFAIVGIAGSIFPA